MSKSWKTRAEWRVSLYRQRTSARRLVQVNPDLTAPESADRRPVRKLTEYRDCPSERGCNG